MQEVWTQTKAQTRYGHQPDEKNGANGLVQGLRLS